MGNIQNNFLFRIIRQCNGAFPIGLKRQIAEFSVGMKCRSLKTEHKFFIFRIKSDLILRIGRQCIR